MPGIQFPAELVLKAPHEGGGVWEALLASSLTNETAITLLDIKRLLHIYGVDAQTTPFSFDSLPSQSMPTPSLLFKEAELFSIKPLSSQPFVIEVCGASALSEEDTRRLIASFAPKVPEIQTSIVPSSLDALHHQVSALDNLDDNQALREFHRADDSAGRLTCFRQHMLSHLRMSEELHATRSTEQQLQVISVEGEYQLTEQAIASILRRLETPIRAPLEHEAELPASLKSIVEGYRRSQSLVNIVVGAHEMVTDAQTFFFLQEMSVKTKEKKLNTLNIQTDDYQSIFEGISAYLNEGYDFPAKSIAIKVSKDCNLQKLCTDLCQLYDTLGSAGLSGLSLNFSDSHRHEYNLSLLEGFVSTVEDLKLPLDVTLIKQTATHYQYRLDAATGEPKRKLYAAKILQASEVQREKRQARAPSVPRKRVRNRGVADVELSEELAQVVQVSVNEELDNGFDLDTANEVAQQENIPKYNLEDIIKILTADDATNADDALSFKSIIPASQRLVTVYEIEQLWAGLTGGAYLNSLSIRGNERAPIGPHSRSMGERVSTFNLSIPTLRRISQPALIEILMHREAFMDGWDIEAMPPGFFIDENRTLQFDSKLQERSRKSVYYKTTIKKPELVVSIQSLNELLQRLSEQERGPSVRATARFLQAQLAQYQDPYHYQFFELVHQHLPSLLKLTEPELERLFYCCQNPSPQDDSIDFNILKAFLDNTAMLAVIGERALSSNKKEPAVSYFVNLLQDREAQKRFNQFDETMERYVAKVSEITEKISVIRDRLKEGEDESLRRELEKLVAEHRDIQQGHQEYQREQVLMFEAYATSVQKAEESFSALQGLAQTIKSYRTSGDSLHPVLSLIKTNERLSTALRAMNLSEKALDKFLVLYQQFGEEGIAVFERGYEASPPFAQDIIREYYFSNSDAPLDALIASDNTLQMLSDLESTYHPEEKAWFIALMRAHLKYNPNTPITTLVLAFNEFIASIRDEVPHDLGPLPPVDAGDFSMVTDMVVSLSRMKGILKKADARNVELLWRSLPKLDLRSGGVQSAMLVDEGAMSIVTPEMQVTPPHINSQNVWGEIRLDYTPVSFLEKFTSVQGDEEGAAYFLEAGNPAGCEFRQAFYRYVASRRFKYSLEKFYEPLLDKIENHFPEDWGALDKLNLYNMIARSTTTIAEEKLAYASDEEALAVWEQLIDEQIKNKTVLSLHIGKHLVGMIAKNLTVVPNSFTTNLLIRKLASRISIKPWKFGSTKAFFQRQLEILNRLSDTCLHYEKIELRENVLAGLGLSLQGTTVADDADTGSLERYVQQMELVERLFKKDEEGKKFGDRDITEPWWQVEPYLDALQENMAPDFMFIVGLLDSGDDYLLLSENIVKRALDVYFNHKIKDSRNSEVYCSSDVNRMLRKVIGLGFKEIKTDSRQRPPYAKLMAFFDELNRVTEEVVAAYNHSPDTFTRTQFHDELMKRGFKTLQSVLGDYFEPEKLEALVESFTTDKAVRAAIDKLFLAEEQDERQSFERFLNAISAAAADQKIEIISFYAALREHLTPSERMRLLGDLGVDGALSNEQGEPLTAEEIILLLKSLNTKASLADFSSFCQLCKDSNEGVLPPGALLKASVYVKECRKAIYQNVQTLNTLFRKQLAINLLTQDSSINVSSPISSISFFGEEVLEQLSARIRVLDESTPLEELQRAQEQIAELSQQLALASDAYNSLFDKPGDAESSLQDAVNASLIERIEALEAQQQLVERVTPFYQEVQHYLAQNAERIDVKDSDELDSVSVALSTYRRTAEELSQPLLSAHLGKISSAIDRRKRALQTQASARKEVKTVTQIRQDIGQLLFDVNEFLASLVANIDKQPDVDAYKREQENAATTLQQRADELGQDNLSLWLTENVVSKLHKQTLLKVRPQGLRNLFATKSFAANFDKKLPDRIQPVYPELRQAATAMPSIRDSFAQALPAPDAISVQSLPWDRANIEALVEQTNSIVKRRQSYGGVLGEVYGLLDSLCKTYPGTERQVKRLADVLVRESDALFAGDEADLKLGRFYQRLQLMLEAVNRCALLNDTLPVADKVRHNTDVMRALCEHVLPTKSHSGMLKRFYTLITTAPYQDLQPLDQAKLLETMTKYLNAGQAFDMDNYLALVQRFKENDELDLLWDIFAEPPCPSIAKVDGFLPVEGPIFRELVLLQLRHYRRRPAPRERENGFSFAFATGDGTEVHRSQAGKFNGTVFDVSDGGALYQLQQQANGCRDLDNQDLLEQFHSFKGHSYPLSSIEAAQYLAVTAELLYRAKAREGSVGSSFEINTTQYLALFAMLTSGRHNMSQIATGEGKTRITMLMAAMQYGLGQTVDLVTSDVALAIRDYNEYQSFFNLLGAKPSLITSNSKVEDYHVDGGIHFSDAGQLSLFRNKALFHGRGTEVINQEKSKRCLLLDEADTTMLDAYRTRYNFSDSASKLIKDMEWVYPYLVHYFEDGGEALFETATKEVFIAWIRTLPEPDVDESLKAQRIERLEELSDNDLDNWFDAADAARKLRYQHDYTVSKNQELREASDGQLYREATLVINNKPESGAKYSFGVQQCLHAYLNYFKAHPRKAPRDLRDLLDSLGDQTAFFLEMEKQIVVSSSSGNLLSDYEDGSLIAVTGTSGTSLHQAEIKARYASDLGDMSFIEVPTHKKDKRVKKGYEVAKDETSQIALLAERVIEARRQNQPILIICENDQESEVLLQALQEHVEGLGESIARVSAKMSNDEVAAYVRDKAGKPGQVTVATGRLGRGTDISLKTEEAKQHGLAVMITHIPESRDGRQYEGRSARFGAEGSAEYILDLAREKTRFDNQIFLKEGHYDYGDECITLPQKLRDATNQVERLLKLDNADYVRTYRDAFFLYIKSADDTEIAKIDNSRDAAEIKEDLIVNWLSFQRVSDGLWKSVLAEVLDKVALGEEIGETVESYQQDIQALWVRGFGSVDALLQDNGFNPPSLEIKPDVLRAIGFMQRPLTKVQEVEVFDGHDIALPEGVFKVEEPFYGSRHDRITLYAQNTADKPRRSWGQLWSDVKSWWRGDISFRELRTREVDDGHRRVMNLPEPNNTLVFSKLNTEESPEVFKHTVTTQWQAAEKDYERDQSRAIFGERLAEMEGREPNQTAALHRLHDLPAERVEDEPVADVVPDVPEVAEPVDPIAELGVFRTEKYGADENAVFAVIMKDMEQPYLDYAESVTPEGENSREYAAEMIQCARAKIEAKFDFGQLVKDRRANDREKKPAFLRGEDSRGYNAKLFSKYLRDVQKIDLSAASIAHEVIFDSSVAYNL